MDNQRPMIGSGPGQSERSFGSPNSGAGQGGSYPGIGNPFGQQGGGNLPVPFQNAAQVVQAAPKKSLLGGLNLGNFNLEQITSFVDRMGGIDGIVNTMTKVQKIFQTFQQVAPMFKVIAGSFGGAGKVKNNPTKSKNSTPNKARARKKKRATSVKKYPRPTGRKSKKATTKDVNQF
jgi:hypothetical protein